MLFQYIESETIESQNFLPWLNKTSFIDVSHTIRELKPIEVFQSDNQDFLEGYINEVKPYHSEVLDRGINDNSLQQLDIAVSETLTVTTTDTQYLTTETGEEVWIDRQRNGNPVRVIKHGKLKTESNDNIMA